jgi:hypothetical protein
MDHEDNIWVIRTVSAVGNIALWVYDLSYAPCLFAHAPYHDPVAANPALVSAMYLFAGPMFVVGSIYLFETDNEPTVNTEKLLDACAVKLTLPYVR